MDCYSVTVSNDVGINKVLATSANDFAEPAGQLSSPRLKFPRKFNPLAPANIGGYRCRIPPTLLSL